MNNIPGSSAKLFLIACSVFAFISCKNSASGPEQAKNPVTAKDSAKITIKKPAVFKPPVLKIGKSVDYENEATLGSSIFTPDDTVFAYYLLHYKKFDVPKLNLRFYKVEEGGVDLLESVAIEVDPQGNTISDSFRLYKVYDEFGKGQFEMQFLHQDSIIASKSFLLL